MFLKYSNVKELYKNQILMLRVAKFQLNKSLVNEFQPIQNNMADK